MSSDMSKQEKREARIRRQTEKVAKMQAAQRRRMSRPRRGVLPESWRNKYLLIIVVIAAIALNVVGKVSVTPDDSGLDIKAFCISARVDYADITSLDYYDYDVYGKLFQGRSAGFLNLDTLRVKGGTFNRGDILKWEKYSGFSTYQLYADSNFKGDYVIMTVYDDLTESDVLYMIGAKTVDAKLLWQEIRDNTGL